MNDAEHLRLMTDGIVGAQAGHRRRTQWALFAGFAIAVAVAVPVAVVMNQSATTRGVAAGGDSGVKVPVAARQKLSVDATIYAVVLSDWSKSGVLAVHDRICTSAGVCSAGRPTQQLRRDLGRLVGPRLQFTASALDSIALQKLTVHGSHATAVLKDSCGRGCFSGERVHLTRTGATWRITGDREQWIT